MNNLQKILRQKGFTQRTLAERVGVDQSTIQRAAQESPSAKLETYRLCAQALGVTMSDIFADERTSDEQEILEIYRRVPLPQRSAMIAALRLAEQHDPATPERKN